MRMTGLSDGYYWLLRQDEREWEPVRICDGVLLGIGTDRKAFASDTSGMYVPLVAPELRWEDAE